PDSTPHEGIHATYGDWMLMGHALLNGVYDKQGGPRGGEKGFVGGMVMGMAQRPLGDGTLGFRAMLSPEPFLGPRGYPLLVQPGLESTHITAGVVTAGLVLDNWKVEASAFRGREPDQHRFDIEAPKLDSASARLSWNPTRELSMQVSFGHLHSPEQLAPNVNEDRITASATYTRPLGDDALWSST